MDEGKCPHCLKDLTFDDDDNLYEVVECPTCSEYFLLSEAKENVRGSDLLRISTRTVRNKDGSIKAGSGYKGTIFSVVCDKSVKVSAGSYSELLMKILDKGSDLREKASMTKTRESAEEESSSIEGLIKSLENILIDGVSHTVKFDWDDLKKNDEFEEKKPSFSVKKPTKEEAEPRTNFLEKIFSKYGKRREERRKEHLVTLIKEWRKTKNEYEKKLKEWEKNKKKFEKEQEAWNKNIEDKKSKFKKSNKKEVEEFFSQVLALSEYPENIPQKHTLEYRKKGKILVVDLFLPDYEDIPSNKGVKYVKSRNAVEEVKFPDSQRERLYNKILFSIPLRSIHEIFTNDNSDMLKSVVFNGWVDTIDRSTGKKILVCILTIHIAKKEFLEINIKNIDPKLCFKRLKGVGSSKLSSLVPVAPILKIDKKDKRFIASQKVLDKVDDSMNIAAMDWEEFEHLVREVFEKEFAKSGMEVKVTQSSRDLGVDAVAFDPDPVRGGKIIIQAKRYTNTVKVESVRALYGIMQDEGAMKGILVTTSDFGPDAYKFAQGKPITLISGNNLLSMLEQSGHKAKIDIKEAKKILGEDG
jgi:restriction system protein